jgi:hypothetical protein
MHRRVAILACLCFPLAAARAQQPERAGAVVTGRVLVAAAAAPVANAIVTIEGTSLTATSDSAGRYRLNGVRPGPQVLLVRRLGFAPARVAIAVPQRGELVQDVALAETALRLPELIVTADPVGRARGELGTASVIDRDAIVNQTAASLAGVLELVPGVPLQPPGLDGVQQFAIRSVPTNITASFTAGGPTANDLASFGTLIILDGVPVSNNANLQITGPRGELQFFLPTTGGGGIDLRRIPASTLERVEVIRGIPTARYGDLTQGVIVVDTRAGVVEPTVVSRVDAQTLAGTFTGGRALTSSGGATVNLDVAHTLIAPGIAADDAYRFTTQLSHHTALGPPRATDDLARLSLDSRLDFYQVNQNNPEQPDVLPGRASSNHDRGLRLSERARFALGARATLTFTGSADYVRQRSFVQSLLVRGATPFTDRLDSGRAVGRFVGGQYLSKVRLEGDQRQLYARLEAESPAQGLGFDHRVVAGTELRREWNAGPGYIFDIEFPPQVSFNAVNGYDRPRRFDAIPPVATSAFYLDDRIVRTLGRSVGLELQAGLRADFLHRGTTWLTGVRDAVLQPRLNAQLAPWTWLRLRAGTGSTAKTPSLGNLYPAPQYFDVVNVNWYTNDPAERLAILTTFLRDPTSPDLGFAVGHKREAGVEIAPGRHTALGLVAFHDRITGGVGFQPDPGFLRRDHYDFVDSTQGTGQPPTIVEPASRSDTVPILVDRPANILTLESHGWEGTLTLPEIRPLRLQLSIQGALVRTRFFQAGADFGRPFSDFQLSGTQQRSPYWENITRTSERTLLTYRLVHHQPELGLVVTAVIEHFITDRSQDVGATDTLAFAGYVTRTGQLVPVPPDQRGNPAFADLRITRAGVSTARRDTPADWLMSLQVSKTLPLEGRLSFYAFNAFDRLGRIKGTASRTFPRARFGLEVAMPLGRMF